MQVDVVNGADLLWQQKPFQLCLTLGSYQAQLVLSCLLLPFPFTFKQHNISSAILELSYFFSGFYCYSELFSVAFSESLSISLTQLGATGNACICLI